MLKVDDGFSDEYWDEQISSGRQLYAQHMRHMKRRKTEPGYFDESCSACQMHREKEEIAKQLRADYSSRVDRAWDKYEQR